MGFIQQARIALSFFSIFAILCGLLYPALITIVAQQFFPWQANGSIIKRDDKQIGSSLIGQNFTSQKYFWGRPSATQPFPYNAEASMGSNLAPSNILLIDHVKERVRLLKLEDAKYRQTIPIDLVTSSASGLDPEITIRGALMQLQRVANARNIDEKEIYSLVMQNTSGKKFWIFGLERINVLQLNLELDKLSASRGQNGS